MAWGIGSALLTAGAVVWLLTGHLGVHTSRHSVVDESDPEQARLTAYHERFGGGADLIVVLESSDIKALRKTADAIGQRLDQSDLGINVFYRVDLDALAENGMYYLPVKDLTGLRDNLQTMAQTVKDRPRVKKTVVLQGIPSLVRQMNASIDAFVDGQSVGIGNIRPTDHDIKHAIGFTSGVIDELRGWLDDPDRNRISLKATFTERASGLQLDEHGYLVANKGQLLMMQVRSHSDVTDEAYAGPLTEAVQAAVRELTPEGVTAGLTGMPVLIHEEQSGLKVDLPLTTGVSIIGCLLIFFIAYRSVRGTLVVMLPLGVGIAWALASTALLIGSLNLITSIFAVILVGMGIDFSVHLFTRMRDERKTYGPVESARRGLAGTGPAVLMGAITSAAAFGVMALHDFRATRELGIIASTGLLLVMVATFILIPMLLGRPGTGIARPLNDKPLRQFTWPKRATAPLLVAALIITGLLTWAIEPIDFNFDAKTYLPQDSPAIETAETLERHGIGGLQYAVTQSHSLAETQAQYQHLLALQAQPDAVVGRIESIVDVLPPDLAEKEPIVAEIRRLAGLMPRARFEPQPDAGVTTFAADLEGLIERLRDDIPFELERLGRKDMAQKVAGLLPALERLHKSVAALDPQVLRERLTRFEWRISVLSSHVDRFFHERGPLTPDRLPEELVSSFYRPGGANSPPVFAIRVYPAGDATDPAFSRRFTRQLRDLDSEATGLAITYMHFGVLMQNSLVRAGMWATLVVIFLVFIDLRSLRDVLLALIPLAIGGVWMVGLMNVLGIDYTFANVLAIPLIIGIGIDSGIHVIHRWRECHYDVGQAVYGTGKAILVSSLTTMCAFGSLMLSSNGGGKTLGLTLVLGVGACLVTSLLVLPALLDLVSRRMSRPG